jgi:carbon storage regulator CsrA
MFVIDRKLGQAFCLNEDVRILVMHIAETRVKLGIEAPGCVKVLRQEIRDLNQGRRSICQCCEEPVESRNMLGYCEACMRVIHTAARGLRKSMSRHDPGQAASVHAESVIDEQALLEANNDPAGGGLPQ